MVKEAEAVECCITNMVPARKFGFMEACNRNVFFHMRAMKQSGLTVGQRVMAIIECDMKNGEGSSRAKKMWTLDAWSKKMKPEANNARVAKVASGLAGVSATPSSSPCRRPANSGGGPLCGVDVSIPDSGD